MAGKAFGKLWDLVVRLRAPDGCPWDRAQTLRSMKKELLEEVYELLDAVESDDRALEEELGDVLLTVTMILRIAQEERGVDPERVMEATVQKMIHLHPHVFGEARARTAEEVLRQWERLRRQSGKKRLMEIPRTLPALLRAQKLGERAARVGFDWPGPEEAWEKVREEVKEVEQASGERQKEELGDLLFALAQWARLRGWTAEEVLQKACDKFATRFERMQTLVEQAGERLEDMSLSELEAWWQRSKDAPDRQTSN